MFNSNYNSNPDLILENCRIFHRNFEGRQTKFNREGDRSFSVVIDPANVEYMQSNGWNVKCIPARDDVEGSEPTYFIDVRVNMRSNRPPKVYIVTSKNKTQLDEQDIGTIDTAEIKTVDLVIHPSFWEMNGKSGVKAYLKTMYVTIEEDVFAEKYENLGNPYEEDTNPYDGN